MAGKTRLAAFTTAAALLGLSCVPTLVCAQTPAVTYEAAFDLRARTGIGSGAMQKPLRTPHTSSARIRADLGGGLSAEAWAADRYAGLGVLQATLEKEWSGGSESGRSQRLAIGILPLPFGVWDTRETYASGLIDYPLARSDYALHSVDWAVNGARYTAVLSPRLQIEGAAFAGRATGLWNNHNQVSGGVLRVQTYLPNAPGGALILGASRWDGRQTTTFEDTNARAVHLNGLDARFTRPHLTLRGEFLWGTLAGDAMRGAYLDAFYHLPGLGGKWTLAARGEIFEWQPNVNAARQVTLGARYIATPEWTLAVNWRRNYLAPNYAPNAWTPRSARGGDLLFQIYRKVK